MTNPANAASREARWRIVMDLLREVRPKAADISPNGNLANRIVDALADEAASQPREGVVEQMRHALAECRDQMWHLAKDPKTNPWILEADAALAAYALHDTAPTDQAQRGGDVERDALIAAAWKSIDEGDASGLGHASFPTTWGMNEDPHVCYVDGTFHLGDLVDAILAALAQSGKGVISTPNMPKGGEQ